MPYDVDIVIENGWLLRNWSLLEAIPINSFVAWRCAGLRRGRQEQDIRFRGLRDARGRPDGHAAEVDTHAPGAIHQGKQPLDIEMIG